MKTWVRKSFKVGVLSAGALLLGGTAANADFNSAGNAGLLSGNQINAQLQAPINVCGNAIGVLGNTSAGCKGGSWASLGDPGDFNSFGNAGLLSGNQINAQIQAPIDVCGNAVGILGNATAGCMGGAWATLGGHEDSDHHDRHGHGHGHGYYKASHAKQVLADTAAKATTPKAATTESAPVLEDTQLNSFGNAGVGSGNQINAVAQLPIDVCGNAIGIFGNTHAACVGGANASTDGSETTMNSGFNAGLLSGNQVNAAVQVPIDVCGNAIGLFGNASAACVGGANATTGGGDDADHSWGGDSSWGDKGYGHDGGWSGDSSASTLPASDPSNTSMSDMQNMAQTFGGSSTGTTEGGWDHGYGYGHKGHHEHGDSCETNLNSFGNAGLLSGNQINLQAQAPIDISGNAIGVLGNSFAHSMGGAFATC